MALLWSARQEWILSCAGGVGVRERAREREKESEGERMRWTGLSTAYLYKEPMKNIQ